MLVVELSFPAGRYHATPWGRHVNEGEVEWPPSPWRIVRAVLATWHRKAAEEIPEAIVRRLVEKLCSEAPRYQLPPTSSGHTRHYMPLYNSGRDEKTARVFDVFLRINPDDKTRVLWPGVILDNEERNALQKLLSRLSYLGRAESWVDANLGLDEASELDCYPLGDESVAPSADVVRLLVPENAQTFNSWRTAFTAGNGKSTGRKKGGGVYVPEDLFQALHADTGDLRRDGWSLPPGSRVVEYLRPRAIRERYQSTAARREAPTIARFAVTSPVPPLLTEGLFFAERIHQALVKKSGGEHPVLRGKSEDRKPLSGHQHVHIFCEANRSDCRQITHVTLWAPGGLDRCAETALADVREIYSRGGHMAQLVMLGLGRVADFQGRDVKAGQCRLLVRSRVWKSLTPFVPTRHPKRKLDANGRQIGSPEHDLIRLLTVRGFPEPVSVKSLNSMDFGGHSTRWLEFRTIRHDGSGVRAGNRGWGFRIEFPHQVEGPIAVGYGSHFGLGLFSPE